MTWRVGVDVGGSFTDFAALHEADGRLVTLKVFSRPDAPGAEIDQGLTLLREHHGVVPAEVDAFTHGTTVGINTVIQRNGVKLALLTTRGFEDVLEMARLKIPQIHNLYSRRPEPLVPRDRVFGIEERIRADGTVLTKVSRESVLAAYAALRAAGADAVVISLLHAWRSDAHEREVERILADLDPDLPVFRSGGIWPIIREYERSITACISGYVQPRVASYLASFEATLARLGVPAAPRITKSNGGVMGVAQARGIVSTPEEDEIDKSSAPLIEHLIELRTRLMWSLGGFFVAFLVCFFFAKHIFNLLVIPFQWATAWAGLDASQVDLIYTAPQEFFFTQVKLGMFGGLVIAFPLIATQIYRFVAPGLYKNERAAFMPFLIASPILFLIGGALVYFFFTPMVMWFFLSMQQVGPDQEVQISLLPRVSEYLGLIMTLIFSFGLVFQLPVVTSLMARVGLLTSQGLVDKRKWAIVIAFVVAAVLTPPDPVSQIGLAVPTILLYEVSIWLARRIERAREREREAAARAAKDAAPAEPTPAE